MDWEDLGYSMMFVSALAMLAMGIIPLVLFLSGSFGSLLMRNFIMAELIAYAFFSLGHIIQRFTKIKRGE